MANLTDKLTEIKTHINTLEEHLKDLQEKNRKSSSIKARASAQSAKTLLHSLRKGIMEAVKSIPPKRTNVGSKKALVVPETPADPIVPDVPTPVPETPAPVPDVPDVPDVVKKVRKPRVKKTA